MRSLTIFNSVRAKLSRLGISDWGVGLGENVSPLDCPLSIAPLPLSITGAIGGGEGMGGTGVWGIIWGGFVAGGET